MMWNMEIAKRQILRSVKLSHGDYVSVEILSHLQIHLKSN